MVFSLDTGGVSNCGISCVHARSDLRITCVGLDRSMAGCHRRTSCTHELHSPEIKIDKILYFPAIGRFFMMNKRFPRTNSQTS